MVLASLMHYSDRIKAGVDIVGISHFGTFLKNTESLPPRPAPRRVRRRARRRRWRQVFDRDLAAQPCRQDPLRLFVAQGKNDPRVPYSEAEQIVKAVRGNGQPVWYLLYKDEGHGFQQEVQRRLLRRRRRCCSGSRICWAIRTERARIELSIA